MAEYTSNGGGATHIAKATGQLKDLSSNLSDILIVSGGGGGGLIIGEDTYAGKDAGGISGNGNNSANQTTGYAFGQGESAGGGGGLYGGYKGGEWYKDIPASILEDVFVSSYTGSSDPENFITAYPDISLYLGTEKCIVVGNSNKRAFTNSNGIMVHSIQSLIYYTDMVELLPIDGVKYISE